jgi:NAD-dependent SIR2 family protein deacetylase
LKPATIAFGEDVPMSAWRTAEAEAVRCGALLVVGTQLAVSSATALVASARARGASCVFIALGPLTFPVFPGDVVLFQPAESALPALARLLHAGGKEAQ